MTEKPRIDKWKVFGVITFLLVLALGAVQFTVFDPVMEQGSTRFDNIVFLTTADCNGVVDCFVIDADGDTTLSSPTDDQIDFEIGGADEAVMTASTFTLADMAISQTAGVENVGGARSVVSFSIDIDNAASPQTCATVASGETWLVDYVYANVLQNFVCTGDDCTFDVGDAGDQDGLLDLDDAELQTADTEGTGAPAGWQGFMSTDTRGAYFGAGQGFVYVGSPTNIVCTYAGTALAGDGTTANDITIYIVYTRVN